MRILVLGTSHAATLRLAFPAIQAAVPELDLSFWGLPGGAFHKATVGPDGLLRPDPDDAIGLRKAAAWNGSDSIDLAPFDRIFLVGLSYRLSNVKALLRDIQPLDWGSRSGALGVSEAFLAEAVQAEVALGVAAQAARIPFDERFTMMATPFIAERGVAKGGDALTRAISRLPQAARAMDLLDTALTQAHAERGVTFVPQPRQTLAAPFLTQDRFLENPEQDARHMNSDYGLIAFRALMATALDDRSAPAAPRAAQA